MELATSDAHEGLKQALQEAFPGLILEDVSALEKVAFVMKGGILYKQAGRPVVATGSASPSK